jgi:hypothetical protein
MDGTGGSTGPLAAGAAAAELMATWGTTSAAARARAILGSLITLSTPVCPGGIQELQPIPEPAVRNSRYSKVKGNP